MKLKTNYIVRKVANDTILMDTSDTSRLLRLNGTAAEILRLLTDGLPESDIVKELADIYEVDTETAALDVRRTLENLSSLGALES